MWRVHTSRAINRLLGGRNELLCSRLHREERVYAIKIVNFFFGANHVASASTWERRQNEKKTQTASRKMHPQHATQADDKGRTVMSIIERFRQHEADEQLDLFRVEARPRFNWSFIVAVVIVIATVITLFFAFPLRAEESKSIILRKGIICDTLKQVVEQVESMSRSSATIEGCGILTRPVPAVVTPLHVHKTKLVLVYLARIQIPNMPVQYGYIAWQKAPEEQGV